MKSNHLHAGIEIIEHNSIDLNSSKKRGKLSLRTFFNSMEILRALLRLRFCFPLVVLFEGMAAKQKFPPAFHDMNPFLRA